MKPEQKIEWDNLAKRLQAGEKDVFPAIMEHYRTLIYTIAHRITYSSSDAEDVVQDVFLQVLQKIAQWRGEKFESWLCCIARNRALDLWRKKVRHPVEKEEYEFPEDSLVEEERKELIRNVLQKLPEGQKEILYLKHFQGYSILEIAQIRHCSEGTVKATLFQTFQKLKKEFESAGLVE